MPDIANRKFYYGFQSGPLGDVVELTIVQQKPWVVFGPPNTNVTAVVLPILPAPYDVLNLGYVSTTVEAVHMKITNLSGYGNALSGGIPLSVFTGGLGLPSSAASLNETYTITAGG